MQGRALFANLILIEARKRRGRIGEEGRPCGARTAYFDGGGLNRAVMPHRLRHFIVARQMAAPHRIAASSSSSNVPKRISTFLRSHRDLVHSSLWTIAGRAARRLMAVPVLCDAAVAARFPRLANLDCYAL
jgi:hypothetical protein